MGMAGSHGVGEPIAVELSDGRILMYLRSNMGRFFSTYSDDQGETWYESVPVESLVCPPTPCCLRVIPKSSDLLIIWNQVSHFESMKGYYRHRLSCAVSRDEGKTWGNFKNLESLDDTTYIQPAKFIEAAFQAKFSQPEDRKRYHRAPGPLRMSYPTCTFIDNKAVISYGVSTFGDKISIKEKFGVELDDLTKAYGFYPRDRGNRVRIIDIKDL